jgi:hypothetical protein
MKYIYLFMGVVATASMFYFNFALVAFSGPGVNLPAGLERFINFSLLALPAITVLAGILMACGFFLHWQYVYRWLLLPIPFAVIYFLVRFYYPFAN